MRDYLILFSVKLEFKKLFFVIWRFWVTRVKNLFLLLEKMKFWYPSSVIHYFFLLWTVPESR